MYSDEGNRDYFEQKMKKYEDCINTPWDTPIPVAIERDTRGQERKEIKKDRVITSTDIEQDKDKEDEYLWKP